MDSFSVIHDCIDIGTEIFRFWPICPSYCCSELRWHNPATHSPNRVNQLWAHALWTPLYRPTLRLVTRWGVTWGPGGPAPWAVCRDQDTASGRTGRSQLEQHSRINPQRILFWICWKAYWRRIPEKSLALRSIFLPKMKNILLPQIK